MDKETEEKIEDLVGFIESSNLNREDKNLWFNAVKEMPKEAIVTLRLFMKNAQEDLYGATELMKSKRDALLKGDDGEFRKIIKGLQIY